MCSGKRQIQYKTPRVSLLWDYAKSTNMEMLERWSFCGPKNSAKIDLDTRQSQPDAQWPRDSLMLPILIYTSASGNQVETQNASRLTRNQPCGDPSETLIAIQN